MCTQNRKLHVYSVEINSILQLNTFLCYYAPHISTNIHFVLKMSFHQWHFLPIVQTQARTRVKRFLHNTFFVQRQQGIYVVLLPDCFRRLTFLFQLHELHGNTLLGTEKILISCLEEFYQIFINTK